jgi:hypothetical protein
MLHVENYTLDKFYAKASNPDKVSTIPLCDRLDSLPQ